MMFEFCKFDIFICNLSSSKTGFFFSLSLSAFSRTLRSLLHQQRKLALNEAEKRDIEKTDYRLEKDKTDLKKILEKVWFALPHY